MDPGVAPLFPTDSAGPAPTAVIAVAALDLPAGATPQAPSGAPVGAISFSEATAPQRPLGPAGAWVAFDDPDDPAVVAAMRDAAQRFPALCAEREILLRSRFREILPFTFDGIAQYGHPTLDRNTTLLVRVTAESQAWSELALAESIQAIIDAAKPGHGLFGFMHTTLDGPEIHRRLGGLAQAADALRERIDALATEQADIADAFQAHLAVLAVCISMQSQFADVIQRRATLFAQAHQECQLAATQIQTLRTGVREGILRLDEVRNVTMPAMGFLQGA